MKAGLLRSCSQAGSLLPRKEVREIVVGKKTVRKREREKVRLRVLEGEEGREPLGWERPELESSGLKVGFERGLRDAGRPRSTLVCEICTSEPETLRAHL